MPKLATIATVIATATLGYVGLSIPAEAMKNPRAPAFHPSARECASRHSQSIRQYFSAPPQPGVDNEDEDEDDDIVINLPRRGGTRPQIFQDSSDEEDVSIVPPSDQHSANITIDLIQRGSITVQRHHAVDNSSVEILLDVDDNILTASSSNITNETPQSNPDSNDAIIPSHSSEDDFGEEVPPHHSGYLRGSQRSGGRGRAAQSNPDSNEAIIPSHPSEDDFGEEITPHHSGYLRGSQSSGDRGRADEEESQHLHSLLRVINGGNDDSPVATAAQVSCIILIVC